MADFKYIIEENVNGIGNIIPSPEYQWNNCEA